MRLRTASVSPTADRAWARGPLGSRTRTWCSLYFYPVRQDLLVGSPQALTLDELPLFHEDVQLARDTYEKRKTC